MRKSLSLLFFSGAFLAMALPIASAFAEDNALQGSAYLRDSQALYSSGQYFKSARYAFAASEADGALKPEAYSWVTLGLMRANLPNAASYFFVRTLQSGNKGAIRRVLTETDELLTQVGGDLLRKYLVRHTAYEDYDSKNRSAYLYSLGKDAILNGQEERAIGYLNGISSQSSIWPFSLQLRGTAQAIRGQSEAALKDFRSCAENSDQIVVTKGRTQSRIAQKRREASDLRARCIAGEARTLYQMGRFDEADRTYDSIPKGSLVWADILFEQAWNSFGKREYNRTLGKLVSYKSPALKFVFNTEVDVLRAQSYLALCLYGDANQAINEFNAHYAVVGEKVKKFVEANSSNLSAFYDLGRAALRDSLYTQNEVYQMTNRFIRGPYFQNLVASEREISGEANAVLRFSANQPGVSRDAGQGFPGFLDQVLRWRGQAIRQLGGAFVKNSLMDYHTVLIADFEKMSFIKLEMLKRAKEKLLFKNRATLGERDRGNISPSRRDDQMFWSFNGEFWNDELGDYVFGLESECKGENGA